MPRQSRGRSAPAPRAAAAPAQSRGSHTAAAPTGFAPAHAPAPPAKAPSAAPPAAATSSGQPGMLPQMAATAGSVAVGSTIGHGISSMLFGGSSSTPAETQAAPAVPQQQYQNASCDVQAKEFTKCLEKADVQSCSWYLDQLKACQAAAAPY